MHTYPIGSFAAHQPSPPRSDSPIRLCLSKVFLELTTPSAVPPGVFRIKRRDFCLAPPNSFPYPPEASRHPSLCDVAARLPGSFLSSPSSGVIEGVGVAGVSACPPFLPPCLLDTRDRIETKPPLTWLLLHPFRQSLE